MMVGTYWIFFGNTQVSALAIILIQLEKND